MTDKRTRSTILQTGSTLSGHPVPGGPGGDLGLPPPAADRTAHRAGALPSVPADTVGRLPHIVRRMAGWDRAAALAALGGLQLEPGLHANHIRLTWAMRLVLGLAKGGRRVGRPELLRLLNVDLEKADVLRLEDPSEDFFLSPIATRTGEFPILMGTWSHPAFYVECLVEAFERIAGAEDLDLIASNQALLALSRAVAARAGLDRRIAGGGRPGTPIGLPAEARLAGISGHVRWTPAELQAAGIECERLPRFVLDEAAFAVTLAAKPANAPIDFKPLVRDGAGFILAAPSAISMAVRAAIADHALETGRDAQLADALLEVQAERLSESRFAQTEGLVTRRGSGEPLRSHVFEPSAGRHLHLEQIVGDFADWREYGFGEPWPARPARNRRIVASMLAAQTAARATPGFRSGATIYLMGGWGKGERFGFNAPEALDGWRFIGIEVADAIALAGCANGTAGDLVRIDKLAELVRRQGFDLRNLSGPLNLFRWWRETGHTLVPQHGRDLTPPLQLAMPTDLLFDARREGAEAHDRRAVARPGGGHATVLRLDPFANLGRLEPIYVSYDALRSGQLVGVTLAGRRPAWLRIARPAGDEERLSGAYENWVAALHWLTLIMPLADLGPDDPVSMTLQLAAPVTFGGALPDGSALDADVTAEVRGGEIVVRAGETWQQGARRVDNRAEIALAAAMLEGVAITSGIPTSRGAALARVRDAVPSGDVRWRHAYAPDRAADLLRLDGVLSQRLRETPRSAASLIKHGHAFGDSRRPGTIVTGKDACAALLAELHAGSLTALLDAVAPYDRRDLVATALGMLQASVADEQHWALTARALRGIHGHDADLRVSLAQRSRVNAAIRASSMLAEVAASHASESDGIKVGDMDYDELSAAALHHFAYCELVPSLAGDRLPPKLIVSPTGDLLYDHSFGDDTLAPSAAAMHSEQRLRQVDEYGSWLESGPEPRAGLEPELLGAVEAEYGASSSALGEFTSALCDLAVACRGDVLLLPRSELIAGLHGNRSFDEAMLARLVDRLTLPHRLGWNDVPAGAHPNDYDLGRFDRPLSMIGRPLLALSEGPDPLLAVGPAAVERSLLHNLAGALNGSLMDRFWSSREMRSQVGRAANRSGMSFNDAIADDLTSIGLCAESSVAPWACLNHKATAAIKLLGDIDVLAFSADKRHAWVIEAKDIKLCRTLGETARRLSDYRGLKRRDGKPDNLLRHLDRVAYVRAHAADLAKRMRLPTVPQVHGLVVVDTPQPMMFVETNPSADARFIRRRDLGSVDWAPHSRGRPQNGGRRRK